MPIQTIPPRNDYDEWVAQPTPDNMAKLLKTMEPAINSEIQRFNGPKPHLRSRARALAVHAIKTYKPTEGAQLRSWVVTQLQPLSRYSQQMRPVHAPEVAIRQAAHVNRLHQELSDDLGREPSEEELADHVGIPVDRIRKIRQMVKPTMAEGTMDEVDADSQNSGSPGVSTANKLDVTEEAVYDSLSPRDKAIFDMKTGKHGHTTLSNQEIAKRLGVTPALISQRSAQIGMQISDLHTRGVF